MHLSELGEEADISEMKQFVDHHVFSLEVKSKSGNNIIDAVWIRRWKWDNIGKRWKQIQRFRNSKGVKQDNSPITRGGVDTCETFNNYPHTTFDEH